MYKQGLTYTSFEFYVQPTLLPKIFDFLNLFGHWVWSGIQRKARKIQRNDVKHRFLKRNSVWFYHV